jgi:hypothetical protein
MDFDQPKDSRDDDPDSGEDSPRGVYVFDRPRRALSSTPIKVRIDQLPKRQLRVDIDQPRALTDDD